MRPMYLCNLVGFALAYFSFREKRNLFALVLFLCYGFAVIGQLWIWYYGLYKGTWVIGLENAIMYK